MPPKRSDGSPARAGRGGRAASPKRSPAAAAAKPAAAADAAGGGGSSDPNRAFALSPASALAALGVSAAHGLDDAGVAAARERAGWNELAKEEKPSLLAMVLEQVWVGRYVGRHVVRA